MAGMDAISNECLNLLLTTNENRDHVQLIEQLVNDIGVAKINMVDDRAVCAHLLVAKVSGGETIREPAWTRRKDRIEWTRVANVTKVGWQPAASV